MKTPTEKQIHLVENMTRILGIKFPKSPNDFTRQSYFLWIRDHIDEYKEAIYSTIYDEDYVYEFCQNDVWCEHY